MRIFLIFIFLFTVFNVRAEVITGYVKFLNQWNDGAVGIQMMDGSENQLNFSGCTYPYAAEIPAVTDENVKNRWYSMMLWAYSENKGISITVYECAISGYNKIVEVYLGDWQ